MEGNIQTGTIAKIDPDKKTGYIVSDGNGELVFFTFDDVMKDVGLGVARVNQKAQFVQKPDPSYGFVATQVAVMPVKSYKSSY
jgi:hypothetical protein